VSGIAIAAEGLGKTYRMYRRPADRLIEAVSGRRRHVPMPALEGVSFRVPAGEGVGIVGENGAGKSTLLKILSGVTAPTAGTFHVEGKVAAILELGSGFHPEFTGRQNAVLNAALLGLSEAEVAATLPRILDFSELGDFIDRPVKTYSTGMAMRLAFSIATQVEPQVLIVDEALSVGDGYFQKKCMDRLLAFIRGGGTVLFCSHAMYYVTALCRHALWLRGGKVERFGPALEVVDAYEAYLLARQVKGELPVLAAAEEAPAQARGPVRLTAVRWSGGGAVREQSGRWFTTGEAWELDVEWQSADAGRGVHVAVGVDRSDGVQVCSFATHQDGLPAFTGRHGRARLEIPALPLVKGEFSLYVFLLDEEGLHVWDQAVLHDAFRVAGDSYRTGLVSVGHTWRPMPMEAMPALAEALPETAEA
jgi:lipopolysaccharide transport system ATP-binding protein